MLPAATEIVCGLGAGDQLVAISHECDYPVNITHLPRITRSRLSIDTHSKDIHESVVAMLQSALSIYEVDAERLKSLNADVVITQDLCDVCAVSYDDICAALNVFSGHGIQTLSLHPLRLEDIFEDVYRIGQALGYTGQADDLCKSLKQRLDRLKNRSQDYVMKTVLMVEWLQPVMIGGLWSAQLADYCHATALASDVGKHAYTLSCEDLSKLDPDVVLIKPCGFSINKTLREIGSFPKIFPWDKWMAVKRGEVYIVDGGTYFNRSGPRIVDSADILAVCLYPDVFGDMRSKYHQQILRVRHDLATEWL